MRFSEFIYETHQSSDHKQKRIAEKIAADCSFYFSLIPVEVLETRRGCFMYHGSKALKSGLHPEYDFSLNSFQERSGPRDTDASVHAALNEYFTEKYGKPFRNALFTTGYAADSYFYSTSSYLILPVGKFEWLSCRDSEAKDMTHLANRVKRELRPSGSPWKDYDEAKLASATVEAISELKWDHNSDLYGCIQDGNEIMVWCEKFYAIGVGAPIISDVVDAYLEGPTK